MDSARFDAYIRRFNERDATAFDDYVSPDAEILNGGLTIVGAAGMRRHYEAIWRGFEERLEVERFVSDRETVAIRMWTRFTALGDDPESLFGPVHEGETFDYRGLIMYHLGTDGRFERIQVSYNSFTRTQLDGSTVELGIPQ